MSAIRARLSELGIDLPTPTTMLRRSFITGAAGLAALSGTELARAAGRPLRVGVIGGGIIGASIALRLAREGASVVVFEKNAPAAGATGRSVAWINAVVQDAHYARLRLASMAAWRKDDAELGMGAVWGGSISWADGPAKGAILKAKADLLMNTNDPPKMLDSAGITRASPGVFAGDNVSCAFRTARDGHVDPVFATNRYLAAARRYGAKVIYPCEVQAIDMGRGDLAGVVTSRGRFALDRLVSAVGTDTPQVMSMVGHDISLLHAPGLVVLTNPQPHLTDLVYEASGVVEFKQYRDGRLLASYTEGPPDLPVHADIRRGQMPFPTRALRRRHSQMLISKVASFMPAAAAARPTATLVGFRPMPLDRRPVVGPVPGAAGVYLVVTHSGVTLAPILGEFVAQEVMTGTSAPLLAPYRPGRFPAAQA